MYEDGYYFEILTFETNLFRLNNAMDWISTHNILPVNIWQVMTGGWNLRRIGLTCKFPICSLFLGTCISNMILLIACDYAIVHWQDEVIIDENQLIFYVIIYSSRVELFIPRQIPRDISIVFYGSITHWWFHICSGDNCSCDDIYNNKELQGGWW